MRAIKPQTPNPKPSTPDRLTGGREHRTTTTLGCRTRFHSRVLASRPTTLWKHKTPNPSDISRSPAFATIARSKRLPFNTYAFSQHP